MINFQFQEKFKTISQLDLNLFMLKNCVLYYASGCGVGNVVFLTTVDEVFLHSLVYVVDTLYTRNGAKYAE